MQPKRVIFELKKKEKIQACRVNKELSGLRIKYFTYEENN